MFGLDHSLHGLDHSLHASFFEVKMSGARGERLIDDIREVLVTWTAFSAI